MGGGGEEYARPSEALERVLDIEEEPHLIEDPSARWSVVASYRALAFSVADISRPLVETGGLCFDPQLRTPHKALFAHAFTLRRLFSGDGPHAAGGGGRARDQGAPLGLKEDAEHDGANDVAVEGLPADAVGFRYFRWRRDGGKLAFAAKVPDGDGFALRLFVVDLDSYLAQQNPPKSITARPLLENRTLTAITNSPFRFLGDGASLLCMCAPENQGPPPAEETVPRGPNIKENLTTKNAPARTYQRLISSKRDEELFEYYTKAEVVLVQFGGNNTTFETVLEPTRGGAMIRSISLSPDKRHFLVSLTTKPFSWTLPYYKFAKKIEVWTLSRPLSFHSAMSSHEAALGDHPQYPKRASVSAISFEAEDSAYNPVDFTHQAVLDNNNKVKENGWADPDLDEMDLAEIEQRMTYHGKVFLQDGRPRNPVGRTGMVGRGLLGKWGPNHAADSIVTRYCPKRPDVLQMVAIQRQDTGHWALPGGMVDPGESVPVAMKREFIEEAGNVDMTHEKLAAHRKKLDQLFEQGTEIYCGYVDDPRNTDNAWMESAFIHFHCDKELGDNIPLAAGDDAQSVRWLDVDESDEAFAKLYASHKSIVKMAAGMLSGDEALRPFAVQVAEIRTVVDLPDQEGMVISFDARPQGPRGIMWHWQKAATLVFDFALDEGNPKLEAKERDAVFELSGPFRLADYVKDPMLSPDARLVVKLDYRISGISWSKASAGLCFVTESWRKTRQTRKWILREKRAVTVAAAAAAADTDDDAIASTTLSSSTCDSGIYEPKVLMHERSSDDAYASTGSIQVAADAFGVYHLQYQTIKNELAFDVVGAGASPVGSRPFIDRLFLDPKGDLSQRRTEHIWRSPLGPEADASLVDTSREPGGSVPTQRQALYEYPAELFPGGEWMLLRRESNDQPPDFFWRQLSTGKEWRITRHAHPQPALVGVRKELVKYKRDDGLDLNGDLYLPPGYDPKRDGPRPCLLWAYPREFKSSKAAGQVKTSPHRFTRTSWSRPVTWVVKDWVVLGFASPIVAEGPDAEPNDTFVEQLRANAQAAVRLLLDRGLGKPGGFAVGGHSYGAFMTAHLLAHTDLFSAGIARSGAYLRALTPFGFQAEERTYWDAPETYAKLSPFSHAPKIAQGTGKLLLVHGIADENPGTFPIQSERLYDALKGHGAITKLVLLPHEGHGYTARESILHTIFEQETWLDKFVLPAFDDNAEIPSQVCASLLGQSMDLDVDAGMSSLVDANMKSQTRVRMLGGMAAATVLVIVAMRALSSRL
ncbi:ADP-ribose pyrophosphatase, mitochondrial [Hondaea fermentalgiana]|uniref:ADP-ribose pyrophosphatase, mitochondrial n=1 Tax=Hondaea fermentalgiana TaxID=2315210 RepID=A0A2R5G582_9STRA|nr:ADP-ribose pyrophosphatase, mitochondrial [Hondaea fermentalgiana]|eukprot:GBG26202.1 ADP-ribose pyrophosphatase, mitochondrial [Hondaea fermentalgiana]